MLGEAGGHVVRLSKIESIGPVFPVGAGMIGFKVFMGNNEVIISGNENSPEEVKCARSTLIEQWKTFVVWQSRLRLSKDPDFYQLET